MRLRACALGCLGIMLRGLLLAGVRSDVRWSTRGFGFTGARWSARASRARPQRAFFAIQEPSASSPTEREGHRQRPASLPKDTLICNSLEDWLQPACDSYSSMLIKRPAGWADVQQEVDDVACRQAFGPTGALAQSVELSTSESSPEQFRADLSAKARCLAGEAQRAGLPNRLCRQIQLDIEEIGVTMARMLRGSPRLNLALEIVGENNCRKWHQDYLLCRAIISYNGCGTEYLDNDNVDFQALKLRGANGQIVKNKRETFSAGIGDMLLMKGCNFPSTANGLVHKSPDTLFHSDGSCVNRLCLKLDVPPQ